MRRLALLLLLPAALPGKTIQTHPPQHASGAGDKTPPGRAHTPRLRWQPLSNWNAFSGTRILDPLPRRSVHTAEHYQPALQIVCMQPMSLLSMATISARPAT